MFIIKPTFRLDMLNHQSVETAHKQPEDKYPVLYLWNIISMYSTYDDEHHILDKLISSLKGYLPNPFIGVAYYQDPISLIDESNQ